MSIFKSYILKSAEKSHELSDESDLTQVYN